MHGLVSKILGQPRISYKSEFLFRAAGALQLQIAAISAMLDRKRTASAADGALEGASRPGRRFGWGEAPDKHTYRC